MKKHYQCLIFMLSFTVLVPSTTIVANSVQSTPMCETEIMVNSPQTVSFYSGHMNSKHYLGTIQVGQHLRDRSHCMKHKSIIAVTWNSNGKQLKFTTNKLYTNINSLSFVQYPMDFKSAPMSNTNLFCQALISNNSPYKVKFYAGNKEVTHYMGALGPFQGFWRVAPCFKNKAIIAEIDEPNPQLLKNKEYKTPLMYNDINNYPVVNFPQDFAAKSSLLSKLIP